MREPVFTETMQLGIVVRDLEATVRRYVEDYGIGPWQVHEFAPDDAEDLRVYGRPVGRSGRGAVTRFAIATVGRVMWELIEPLDEESVWARFLAEKGEGVHHIAVDTPDFDETVARADRGSGVILSGDFGGTRIAYLGTDRDLGVVIEVFGAPDDRPRPDETRP